MKDKTYFFHQTPFALARELVKEVPLESGDVVYEPFRGEGAFYNNLPDNVKKCWAEIEEGIDYRDNQEPEPFDWVITNPPFRLENDDGSRENAFYKIVNYFSDRVTKGMALLGNDYCLATLTPLRLKALNAKGIYIHNIIVCNVKAWRGRYFFIIFRKQPSSFYKFLIGNY